MEEVFRPVWFDSMGAKSSSILVDLGGCRLLVDPGVAIMHPSFPASMEDKVRWAEEGYEAIRSAAAEASIVVITHYHYDHYTDFDPMLYRDKLLLAKDPNKYINGSQRRRALSFYANYLSILGGGRLEEVLKPPREEEYPDTLEDLGEALSKSFGDYEKRRRELLEKGRRWFERRVEEWRRYKRIPELRGEGFEARFADGRSFELCGSRLRFTEPLFHGVEYSRVGWVLGLTIDRGKWRIHYSSDINGPIIEDYASMIIDLNPHILILDGPPTYMLGYMLNNTNLHRAVDNAVRILREAGRLELVIYDHHLLREPRYKERTMPVWREAEKQGVRLTTAAEHLGLKPAVLRSMQA